MSKRITALTGLFLTTIMMSVDTWANESRPIVKLESSKATVVIDLGGGSISEYRLKSNDLNPLQWDSWSFSPTPDKTPPMVPRSMGHFLCLDRWGSASEAEKANGMTNHGEATQVWWAVSHELESETGKLNARLRAKLPMAGINVERSVLMQRESSVVIVEEFVTNLNPIGRIYNIVQHPTIGGPFLNEHTIVDSNGTRGFMQERSMPNPEDPEVRWPEALKMDGTEVDLRFLEDDPAPTVVSYIIEEEYGWVTATSPETGLLLGYLWKTSDYPWLNIWRHVKDGKPVARGLEFGTSGLHQPGKDLVAKGRIFDRPLYRYIDASETQVYPYAMFLLEIPEGFEGVGSVSYQGKTLEVVEVGTGRSFKLMAPDMF